MNRKVFTALVGILPACLASTGYAYQIPLEGSGAHLPFLPFGQPPNEPREIIWADFDVSFVGQWNAPALFPWLGGAFHATGPIPVGLANATGLTFYDDFSFLNADFLPAGTMFRFGDVDFGAGQIETFTLNAWDPSGKKIVDAWLFEPNGVYGTGMGGGVPAAIDMPGWEFNPGTGEYFIDGTTVVGGNPNVAFMLPTIVPIGQLTVFRNSGFSNFSLAAPIPEPCTAALTIAFVWCRRRRRRRAC